MSNQITINHTYYCNASDNVQLPQGKTTKDIKEVIVRYGMATITFSDGSEYQIELEGDTSNSVDWKRPLCMEVFQTCEDGTTDYSQELQF